MKLFYLCLFVINFVVAKGAEEKLWLLRHGLPPPDAPQQRAAFPTWYTIVQRQDNFDLSNTNTWNMRYIENDQFFQEGGPIFILIGAEWTIDPGSLQSGQIFDMADEHNGIMYYTEHRYYGYSYPTKDFTTQNLRFLTVDQALADVASFIQRIKQERPELANSKVVVIGGSYGGTMATWMREKYPNLVDIAYASSAPLLAKYNFNEYNQVVQKDLGAQCASIVTDAANYALNLIRQGHIEKIKNDFNLCNDLNTATYDVANLFLQISSKINSEVQYAESNTINEICNKLITGASGSTSYDSLVNYIRSNTYCMPNYKYLVYYYSNTTANAAGTRSWFYQTCREFGFFQTSEYTNSLYAYGIPIQFFQQICLDIFGSGWTSTVTQNGIANTNKKYGSLRPNITHVVSVHGTVDPWHALGLTASTSPLAPVIIVPGTSHCADMSSPKSSDSVQMYNAKMAVRQYVRQWLQQ